MERTRKSLCSAMIIAALTMIAGCSGPSGDTLVDEKWDIEFAESPLSLGQWVYDAGTQCTVGGTTMHCCPAGYAIIGAHLGNNVFKCAGLSSTSGPPFLDAGTQRNGMHACPYGSVMVGLHLGLNHLACRWPGTPVTAEYVDGNPPTSDGYPMHVCGSGYAMSGIHAGNNLFTCAE